MSVFHTGRLGVVEPSSFRENATQLRDIYRWDPRRVFAFLPFYLDEMMAVFARLPEEGECRVPPCEPQLSSLGIVDGYRDCGVGEGGVYKPKVGSLGVEILLRQIFILCKYRGER